MTARPRRSTSRTWPSPRRRRPPDRLNEAIAKAPPISAGPSCFPAGTYTNCMRIAILSGGDGWHVRDLLRAAEEIGQAAEVVDFRKVSASLPPSPLRGGGAGGGEVYAAG